MKLSNNEAINIIQSEGMGYAVQHFISGEAFKDPQTAALWNAAADALTKLETHLETTTGHEALK